MSLATLAHPSVSRPIRSRRIPPPTFELPSVAFFGRSFAEYCQMFALQPAALRRRPVLDVAAGPSSFTAEACRLGIDAVALDPLYGRRVEALATHIQLDYERMLARIEEKPECFRLTSFSSFEAAARDRRAAAQRFLEDYAAHFAHGRYFGAALPQLPFFDRTFDVVFCAHFLFIYARQFDDAFHLAACRELVRVSRDEVRIHPVCGPDGRPYEHLETLRRDLARLEIDSRVVPIDYEFFVGSGSMLVLTRRKKD
jgi:hypothetical protein